MVATEEVFATVTVVPSAVGEQCSVVGADGSATAEMTSVVDLAAVWGRLSVRTSSVTLH